jgi:hypothetical protein
MAAAVRGPGWAGPVRWHMRSRPRARPLTLGHSVTRSRSHVRSLSRSPPTRCTKTGKHAVRACPALARPPAPANRLRICAVVLLPLSSLARACAHIRTPRANMRAQLCTPHTPSYHAALLPRHPIHYHAIPSPHHPELPIYARTLARTIAYRRPHARDAQLIQGEIQSATNSFRRPRDALARRR